jgi:eukaryotic-like serine/threonine-protein kinase
MGLEGLLTGHLLCDRYRVERVIGRGGMGAVYSATDVRLEREVAVKVITATTADVAARERLRGRFHREARAAARLQHPNVVTVFDFGTDARLGLDFLVMELLRGEDVASRLARGGPPPLAVGLEILEQAARGIGAGHRLGLIHRDVKPGNLFLIEQAQAGIRVCVLDFGIVQLAAEEEEGTMTHLTVAGRAPHSPAFAAPEQLRGDTALAPACDVWGLGATAFGLLTGERPFTDAEQRRMMDGMAVAAPSARARHPSIPEPVDHLLRIALSHHPADRFRDAAEFAEAVADTRHGLAPLMVARGANAPARGAAPQPADMTLLETVPPTRARLTSRWEPPEYTAATADAGSTLLAESAAHGAGIPSRWAGAAPFAPSREYAAPAPAAPRRPWHRRAASALWQFAITVVAFAIAAGCGVGMVQAFYENLTEPFYLAVAGLTLSLPWAVHRLFGRRGSYILAVVGCIAVTVVAFRFAAPLLGPESAVMALAPAQLIAAAWIVRLTRRREPEDDLTALVPSTSP